MLYYNIQINDKQYHTITELKIATPVGTDGICFVCEFG